MSYTLTPSSPSSLAFTNVTPLTPASLSAIDFAFSSPIYELFAANVISDPESTVAPNIPSIESVDIFFIALLLFIMLMSLLLTLNFLL